MNIQDLKGHFARYYVQYLFLCTLIFLSLEPAIFRVSILKFSPLNGDFQTYNVLRRVIDGQIPYVDFANYLGMGVIFINAPFVALYNTFATSIFVTNFLVPLLYNLFIICIVFLSVKRKILASILSIIFICIPLFTDFMNLDLRAPGNSLLIVRSFLPILITYMCVYLLHRLKNKYDDSKIIDISFNQKKGICTQGVIVGSLIVWSNDFGFACVGSAICVFFYVNLCINKKDFKKILHNTIFLILCAFFAYFIAVSIITVGNPLVYYESTLEVSKYQFWYYGRIKTLYFSDFISNIEFDINALIFVILMVYLCFKIYRNPFELRFVFLMFINLAACFAALIYLLGSGGFRFDALTLSLLLSVCALLIDYVSVFMQGITESFLQKCFVVIAVFGLVMSIYSVGASLNMYTFTEKNVPYSESLGGYNVHANSLKKAKELIGNKGVFSSYASALEVELGIFQPSGYDYIIHVLGDDIRQKYLDNFLNGNYTYATTLREDFVKGGKWIFRANWFWYRELYEWYKPHAKTSYSVIWKKTVKEQNLENEVEAKLFQVSENSYELILKTDENIDAIVDVEISYSSVLNGRLIIDNLLKKIVSVFDNGVTYNLPSQSLGYFLPVIVENGHGQIRIESMPKDCTELKINFVKVHKVLPKYDLHN